MLFSGFGELHRIRRVAFEGGLLGDRHHSLALAAQRANLQRYFVAALGSHHAGHAAPRPIHAVRFFFAMSVADITTMRRRLLVPGSGVASTRSPSATSVTLIDFRLLQIGHARRHFLRDRIGRDLHRHRRSIVRLDLDLRRLRFKKADRSHYALGRASAPEPSSSTK